MAICCRTGVCEEMFQPRVARKNLKRYRKKGLDAIERQIVTSISSEERDNARVVEIGGGIGAIQAELLVGGAREGEIVELVSAYEPYARELAQEKGLESRSRFRVVDVLEQPEAVKPAAIVILNRVVCCSPDGVQLATVAARLAERILVLSFPRDRLLVRVVVGAINASRKVMGKSFRVFLHSKASLASAAQAQGLLPTGSGRNVAWEFLVLRRAQ
jgi:magnesium-protoporphyrin O-methyltransferase